MDILAGRFYCIPNSSIYIYVRRVVEKLPDNKLKVVLDYVDRYGRIIEISTEVLNLANITHWQMTELSFNMED